MTAPPVTLLLRVAGQAAVTPPAVNAGTLVLGPQAPGQATMAWPDGQGDVTWQGAEFGLSAPGGASITYCAVTVTHRVSSLSAYSAITAQLIAGGTPVGSPVAFTPSLVYVSETVSTTAGFAPAGLASLTVQLTYHQTLMGMAYVHSAYAQADYSTADSVGIFTVAGASAVAVPVVTVHPPQATLVAAGPALQNLSPVFGRSVTAGHLLLGWVFSNSSSSSFDTTCSNPAWALIAEQGGPFSWVSLWHKTAASNGEAPPVFSTAASTPLTQLLEFTGARLLDQSGTGLESSDPRVVTLAAGGADTASGNLVFGVAVWPGANPTPAALTLAGTDSSGAVMALNVASNAATAGQIPWATGWAQASPPAGPGADTITGTSSIFDFGAGLIASFQAIPMGGQQAPQRPFSGSRAPTPRAVSIAAKAGG